MHPFCHSERFLDSATLTIDSSVATAVHHTSKEDADGVEWLYQHLAVTTAKAAAATWCCFFVHQLVFLVHMWIVAFPLILVLGKMVFPRKFSHWIAVIIGGWCQWQVTGWMNFWMTEWRIADPQNNRMMVWLTTTNITCFCLFAMDKMLSRNQSFINYRIPEVILHTWTWMGGVIGQVLAIRWLRHKSNTDRHPEFVLVRLFAAFAWMAYLGYDFFFYLDVSTNAAASDDNIMFQIHQTLQNLRTKVYNQFTSSLSSSSEL